MSVKHPFVTTKSDGADASLVGATNWNDDHEHEDEAKNLVFAGPVSGADAAPTFRSLVVADIPAGVGVTDHALLSNLNYASAGHTGFLAADGSVAGATGAPQDFGSNGIKADVIAESTGAAGVTADGVKMKDGKVELGGNQILNSSSEGSIVLSAGPLVRLIGNVGINLGASNTSRLKIAENAALPGAGRNLLEFSLSSTQSANITGADALQVAAFVGTHTAGDGSITDYDIAEFGGLALRYELGAFSSGATGADVYGIRITPDYTSLSITVLAGLDVVESGTQTASVTDNYGVRVRGMTTGSNIYPIHASGQGRSVLRNTNVGAGDPFSLEVLRLGAGSGGAAGAATDEGYLALHLDDDSGSAQAEFARQTWIAVDPTAASKDGAIELAVMVANSLTKILTINGSGILVDGSIVPGSSGGNMPTIDGDTTGSHSRLWIENQGTNYLTQLFVMPSGTQDETRINVCNDPDRSNHGKLIMEVDGSIAALKTAKVGSGTAPTSLLFQINSIDKYLIDSQSSKLINTAGAISFLMQNDTITSTIFQLKSGASVVSTIPGANLDWHMWQDADDGEDPEMRLYGYPTGTQLDYAFFQITGVNNDLTIGVNNASGAVVLSPAVDVQGGISLNTVNKTGAYTPGPGDFVITCDASGGAFSINLPAASGAARRIYHIKKIDSSGNAVTVDGNAGETIDGDTTKIISRQYDSMMISCDGSNWHIL